MPTTASTPGPDVLAATDHEVILRAQQFTDIGEPIDCVVYVSRALYYAAFDEFLNQKADYFKHYREFVGIGDISWSGLKLRPGRVDLRTEGRDFLRPGLRCRLVHDRHGARVRWSR